MAKKSIFFQLLPHKKPQILSGFDSPSLASQPSAHCLLVVTLMGVHTALTATVPRGHFRWREKLGTEAALRHNLQSVMSFVF